MADEPKPEGVEPAAGTPEPAKPAPEKPAAAAKPPAAPAGGHAPPKPPPTMAATPWESDLTKMLSEQFDLVYILYSFARNERMRIKTAVADGAKPATATTVFATANWIEREIFDMFGIQFEGHPDMRRILLPEEWEGFPLRKEY